MDDEYGRQAKHSSAFRAVRVSIRIRSTCITIGLFLLCCSLVVFPVSAQTEDPAWSQPLRLGSISIGQANANPTIVSDRANWLHVFWLDVVDDTGSSYIMYTRWNGQAWSVPIDILMSPEPGHVSKRPHAGIGRDGRIHVIWESRLNDIYHSSAPLSDADFASAWSKAVRISIPSQAWTPSWMVDNSGRFHLVYLDYDTQSPHYIYSDDSGLTWSNPVLIGRYGFIEQKGVTPATYMAIDGKGRIHVIWGRSTTLVDYSHSEDGGQTWIEPIHVEPVSGAQIDNVGAPTIGTRGDDEIHLVWSGYYYLMPDGSTVASKKYHKWSTDGGRTWTPTALAWENIVGNNGCNPMILDANGVLHTIVVTGYGPVAIHWVLYSQWGGSNWLPLVAIPGTSRDNWTDLGPFWHDMALSQGNRLNVVWQTRDGDIWYASRQIDAPYIPPRPVLAAEPTAVTPVSRVSPTETVRSKKMVEQTASPGDFGGAVRNDDSSSSTPVVAGILSAALVMAIVAMLSQARRRSR